MTSDSRIVRLGLIQMTSAGDPASNLAKASERIRAAAAGGAKIVCLQELFRSNYFCQTEDDARFSLAEEIPGETTKLLSDVARETGTVLVASLFERRAPGLYHNTAAVIDADGKLLGIYRKMHIPDDPGFYEKYYFTPGDLGFRAFDTAHGRIGVLICWDQWYPEAARLTALAGAGILFYPTAIGWAPGEREEVKRAQHDAWETIQRSHAIANGVFVASVNRVGHEGDASPGGLDFWGGSFVTSPFGKLLTRASHDKEEIVYADCDLAEIEYTRTHWPFLRDRRIDAYAPITARYLA